jgi:LCP family protein required for cell wall assembly
MGRIKRQLYKYLPYSKRLVVLALIVGLGVSIWLIFPRLIREFNQFWYGPRLAYSLLTADTSNLESTNNRTNILILGIGGGEHEGNDLTDTMIFLSINKNTADTVMLSIPRDIWVESLQAKINTAYHYGEEKKSGEGGFVLAKDAVNEVLGQPIHYAMLLDFDGFTEVVDLLGGLDVKVDRTFDDYQYPLAGKENDLCEGDPEYKCRYEHLHFDAGLQHIDGKTALKFVRSRHAQGEEGTDFARSQRQQKIIFAIKDKFFSYKTLLNPQKVAEIKNTLGNHIRSDSQLTDQHVTAFLGLLIRFVKNKNQIRTISLETGTEDNPGFLYNPPTTKYGQWVLAPRGDSWQEVQKFVKEKIYQGY